MNALYLAEQATLGALMLEPDLPRHTARWLRSEDFVHPWHAHVHACIRDLAAARGSTDAGAVGAGLIERLGHRQADVPRLVDLLQAVPTRPSGSRYAAMVLEGSLRRRVACYGVLLKGAALSTVLSGDPAAVEAVVLHVDHDVAASEARWATATGRPAPAPRETAPHGTAPGASVLAAGLSGHVAADRVLIEHPMPTAEQIGAHEAALIGALINHPDRVHDVAGWLHPEAMLSRPWAAAFRAVAQQADAHQPIDAVTIAWELHRTAALHGPGPEVRELRDVVDAASVTDPDRAARVVAGDQLRLIAERAAVSLRTDAGNAGLDLRDLLDTATLQAGAVREIAARIELRRPAVSPSVAASVSRAAPSATRRPTLAPVVSR